MIEEIRIRGLGVIEESVLELGPGLNVISGETGAGKTMLITALGLLLGARADTGAVRTGARQARVEGIVGVSPDLASRIEESGGEVEEGSVVLARQVSSEGRSRAFLGGTAVPISALQSVTDHLVAVHGQSDQHRLLRADHQRAALDSYAGDALAPRLADYVATYAELREAQAELDQVTATVRERAREADLLRLGLEEIGALNPQPGEDTALGAEESRLGFAETLRAAAEEARLLLSADSDVVGATDALTAVSTARRVLDSVRDHDAEAGRLADRMAEIGYLLADVAADTASYASGLEVDPLRLAAVSERRAALATLTRKYGATIEEVIAWGERSAVRLADLDGTDDRIEHLTARRLQLRAHLSDLAVELSSLRSAAATTMADRLTTELAALSMPDARVQIDVTQEPDHDGLATPAGPLRFGPSGIDRVEFLLAANSGMQLRPLDKGASGGELSRVMLAVEVVLAGTDPVPTFVFDEVDAGVGGRAALEIGRRLATLARSAQVLVVTHLPQVASFADRHIVVRKTSDGTVTTSGLELLDDVGRVQELSRMLAGLETSEAAQAHAEELLATAQQDRNTR